MFLFFVDYDLVAPGRDYAPLYARLEQLGGQRLLISKWALRGNYSAEALRDDLMRFIDRNDRLIVDQPGNYAWYNTLVDPAKVAA